MTAEHRIRRLDELALDAFSHGERFAFRKATLGPGLGLSRLGCTMIAVPPGKAAYPFHRHHVCDELFVILAGKGEHRWGEERHPVRAGDIIAAPRATEAHQFVNTGDEELRYLAISDVGSEDVIEYPDSGKVAIAAGVRDGDLSTATVKFLGKLGQPMDYYDGEPDEPARAQASTRRSRG